MPRTLVSAPTRRGLVMPGSRISLTVWASTGPGSLSWARGLLDSKPFIGSLANR
jgi:hypothetical protein